MPAVGSTCACNSDSGGNEGLRWLVLWLNCLLLIGNYYAYDNPAALNTLMRDYLGLDDTGFDFLFGLFYSLYSLPNIVLPFFSGYIIDRLGVRRVLPVLSVLVCIGQSLFLWGVTSRRIWLMLLGRTVFGIGGESVSVAQSCITTHWFHNKELAFALGLNLAVPRAGSVLNAILSPLIAVSWNKSHSGNQGVPVALAFGLLTCILSLLSAVILVYWIGCEPDSLRSQLEDHQSATQYSAGPPFAQNQNTLTPDRRSISSSTGQSTIELRTGCFPCFGKHEIRRELSNVWAAIYASFLTMPAIFWLLCLMVMLFYGIIIPFNNIVSEFLQHKWFPGDPERAGQYMGIPDSISAILVPISGYVVDRYGYRARSLIGCGLGISLVHLSLLFSPSDWPIIWSPVAPLVFLGICYSVFGVAYWSSIACVFSEEDQTPTQNDPESSRTENQGLGILSDSEMQLPAPPPLLVAVPDDFTANQNDSVNERYSASANTSISAIPAYLRSPSLYSERQIPTIKRVSMTALPILAAARIIRGSPSPYISPVLPRRDSTIGSPVLLRAIPSPSVRTERSTRSRVLVRNQSFESGSMPHFEDGETRPLLESQIVTVSLPERLDPDVDHQQKDPAKHLALAYGLSTAAMNTSLTITPLIAAIIRAYSGPPIPDEWKFMPIELFFTVEALLAAILGLLILKIDRKTGSNLEKSHWIPLSA